MKKSNGRDFKKEEATSRGKKPNRNRRPKSRRESSERRAVEESTNDPAWYSTSPELLRDSSSIPFSWPTGTDLGVGNFMVNDRVPGIAAISVKQVIGNAEDPSAPVNVASSAIYSFVRHANSGHSNYDAPDLMLYLLAMSSVYSFITWCQRLLGLVMTYDQRNRYIPDGIIEIQRVSAQDLRNNISKFRFWLNTFINKAASFAVPGVMPYFSRMAFLYSNYYIDGPSIKDQFYMYMPYNREFLKFHMDSTSGIGSLAYESIPLNVTLGNVGVEEIMNFGDDLFSAIWAQEDFGIMSGDILKAYGDNIVKIAPVPEMFILQPVYDAMFLHQFKNAKVPYSGFLYVSPITSEPDGYVSQNVSVASGVSTSNANCILQLFGHNEILSSDFDNPTPEVVIESTRLMPSVSGGVNNLKFHCGSEIPMGISYGVLTDVGGTGIFDVSMTYFNYASSEQTMEYALQACSMSRFFKYAPEIIIGNSAESGIVYRSAYRIWDIDNYAVLSADDLEKMHQAALMSLLAVPSIAKVS